jgi:hypothetical protein
MSVRGLPRDPAPGEDAYCWDTAFAALFLQAMGSKTSDAGVEQ